MLKTSGFKDYCGIFRYYLKQRKSKYFHVVPDEYGNIEFYNAKRTKKLPVVVEISDLMKLSFTIHNQDHVVRLHTEEEVINHIIQKYKTSKGYRWEKV